MKKRTEKQILIMLGLFSVSIGLWGNFRQLWLQDNGFSPTQISGILSIGTFVSILGIIVVGRYVGLSKLKKCVTITIILKLVNSTLLSTFNHSSNAILIDTSIIIDILLEYIVITSIYPLITMLEKNNNIYSKRKLTEYLFRDIGILIGGLLIGKTIIGLKVNYNICLMISNIFLIFAADAMLGITGLQPKEIKRKHNNILNYIKGNKILSLYLVYSFIGAVALSTSLGLKMLTLTNYYQLSDLSATNYLLIVGIIADIIGIVVLKYFTPKNDYITITIKFGIRFIGYAIAFLSNNIIIIFLAMTWSLLISTAYENVCDGPYINSIENKYQLQFTDIKYVIHYLGEAVGIFFCGIMYAVGLRYMFGLSAFFMIFQLILAYYLIYLRKSKKIVK